MRRFKDTRRRVPVIAFVQIKYLYNYEVMNVFFFKKGNIVGLSKLEYSHYCPLVKKSKKKKTLKSKKPRSISNLLKNIFLKKFLISNLKRGSYYFIILNNDIIDKKKYAALCSILEKSI